MEFRDLKKQYEALKERIDEEVLRVLSEGSFIGGVSVSELERQLAGYVGVKHAVTCANGTDALTLALKVWGIGAGDAVFVPDFTFFSSAETISAEGAVPVFVDVCEETFNIDPADLERKIAALEKDGRYLPRAVVTVDLFGLPANYRELLPLAAKHGLLVLEDGAQGFGGSIDGRKSCSFGDISTTSFFPAKPLGCYGDGGAVFTDNEEWAAKVSSLKVHGKGSSKYDNIRIGMNSRLDTVQAAVLQVKLDAFRKYEMEAVQRVAAHYSELFADAARSGAIGIPRIPEGFASSWAQYTVRLRERETRDRLKEFLAEKGIPSNIYYPSGMHSQTAFSDVPSYGSCPVSESLCGKVLSFPIHPYMTEAETDKVAASVLSFLNY